MRQELGVVSGFTLFQITERNRMHSIVTTWTEKPVGTLAELHPEEIEWFRNRFIWPYQTGGFYTRIAYEKVYGLPKWRPFKSQGQWQKLYSELVDVLVEKHLDFDRFCRTPADRMKPPEYETAFWLGMMAGKYTYNDCIDIDSHEVIGWNSVPTRWHPIHLGDVLPGPISWRSVPVIRPSLRFFQIAKVVHDNFPNRIWTFSSANLGLAVWKTHHKKQLSDVLHRKCTTLFRKVGLPAKLEHYPRPPASPNSFGRCHRRPCGMDSGIITQNGVILDSLEQIRHFMAPPRTPSFKTIVRACFTQMRLMYESFLAGGESVEHTHLSREERQHLVADCLAVVREIKAWLRAGCPIDYELVAGGTNEQLDNEPSIPPVEEEPESAVINEHDGSYPDCFWKVDLKEVSRSGQWVQFVKFLVENGFPCDDCFLEVISTLAKWFLFVELHEQEPERVQQVLFQYVARKHNGKVTRWLEGKESEVFRHIGRIVSDVIKNESDEGGLVFADIRQKRESGRYAEQYNFELQITEGSSFPSVRIPSSHLIRGGISEDGSDKKEWQYVADNTPLPESLQHRLLTAFENSGRPLRRRDGEYPTLVAITRFFNYLVSGRKPGQRRASKKLLHEMGFPSKTREQQAIVKVLVPTFVVKGDYRSKTKSRLWILDKHVLEELSPEQITPEPTSTEGE